MADRTQPTRVNDDMDLTSHSWLLDTLLIPVFWMIVSEHSFLDVTQPPTAVAAFD